MACDGAQQKHKRRRCSVFDPEFTKVVSWNFRPSKVTAIGIGVQTCPGFAVWSKFLQLSHLCDPILQIFRFNIVRLTKTHILSYQAQWPVESGPSYEEKIRLEVPILTTQFWSYDNWFSLKKDYQQNPQKAHS